MECKECKKCGSKMVFKNRLGYWCLSCGAAVIQPKDKKEKEN